jgi:hypothetical protein
MGINPTPNSPGGTIKMCNVIALTAIAKTLRMSGG